MKTYLLLLVLITGMHSAYAQSDFRDKCIAVYGEANWEDWEATNPALLRYLEAFAARGVSLQPYHEKYADAPMLDHIALTGHPETEVTLSDFLAHFQAPGFNLLEYNFQVTQEIQVFRIPIPGQVLVIASRSQLQSN